MKFLGRPLPGAAMLGGFAALTGAVGNITVARAAYAFVLDEREALSSHA
jgi:hypothetical protein